MTACPCAASCTPDERGEARPLVGLGEPSFRRRKRMRVAANWGSGVHAGSGVPRCAGRVELPPPEPSRGCSLAALGGALPLFPTFRASGPEEGASPGGDALGT